MTDPDLLIKQIASRIRESGDVEAFERDPEGYLQRKVESMTDDAKEGLTVSEVAEILNLSERTIQRKLRSGELSGAKVGGYWRISKADLKKWWREQGGDQLFRDDEEET